MIRNQKEIELKRQGEKKSFKMDRFLFVKNEFGDKTGFLVGKVLRDRL